MHSELKWFLLLFVGLWLAWLVTGGPSRIEDNRTHPFLDQPAPIGTGKTYTAQQLRDQAQP